MSRHHVTAGSATDIGRSLLAASKWLDRLPCRCRHSVRIYHSATTAIFARMKNSQWPRDLPKKSRRVWISFAVTDRHRRLWLAIIPAACTWPPHIFQPPACGRCVTWYTIPTRASLWPLIWLKLTSSRCLPIAGKSCRQTVISVLISRNL